MVDPNWVPGRGELVWLNFSPHAGHEQGGRRPGLVLSPAAYNRKAGLALICPVTSKKKGYPFEVSLPANATVTGVVLSDHVRNVDWRARGAEFAGRVTQETLSDVLQRLEALLGPDLTG